MYSSHTVKKVLKVKDSSHFYRENIHFTMFTQLITTLIVFFIGTGEALVQCNGTVTKLQLCSIDKSYNKMHTMGQPGTIWSSINLNQIAELNAQEQTITLDLVLSVWWYDQRITIESNDPSK